MRAQDRAITVFSPDGQLLQVHYAQEAVRKGSAVVGVRGADSIVLATEKRVVCRFQDDRTEKKIHLLDRHVVLAFAGLRADARVLIGRTQIECQAYRLTVEDPVSLDYVTRYVASMKQFYTQGMGRRPFGLSCLIAGYDPDGTPHLYQTEPSGVYFEWKAAATGRNDKQIRQYLEKNYTAEQVATEEGAVRLAFKALMECAQPGCHNYDAVIIKRNQILVMKKEDIQTVVSLIQRAKEETEKTKKK